MKRLFFSSIPVLLFLAALSYSATQHITPAANLQSAVNQLTAGDTLFLATGTYVRDTSLFLLNLKGTSDKPIVVCNEPGQTPIIRYDSLFSVFVLVDSGGAAMNDITVGNCSFLEIAGLEITNGRSGIETHYGDNDHITIRDCHIHDVGNVGIRIATDVETYFRCVHNHIHHTGVHGEGFYVGDNPPDANPRGNPSFCEFVNNWIHNTANIPSPDNQGDGIELKSGCRNMTVRNNVIHNTKYPCITLWGTAGGTLAQNNKVYDNLMFNSKDADLQVTGETDVFNNIMLNSLDSLRRGISVQENLSSGTRLRLARVFNNTLVNTYAFFENSINDSDSCSVANNAVYNAKGYAVRFSGQVDSADYGTFSHNIIYGTPFFMGDTITGFSKSTQALQAFANTNAFDYYPSANSELKGAGANLSTFGPLASVDFNGTARGTLWSVGAYQYNAAQPSNPGWVLKDWGGGFMDTLLTGPNALETFFSGFDTNEPLNISASPNPFKSATTLTIAGLNAARRYNPMAGLFLGVYNSRGQLVKNLTPELIRTQGNILRWHSTSLPADRYFIRLTAGNRSTSQSIIHLQ